MRKVGDEQEVQVLAVVVQVKQAVVLHCAQVVLEEGRQQPLGQLETHVLLGTKRLLSDAQGVGRHEVHRIAFVVQDLHGLVQQGATLNELSVAILEPLCVSAALKTEEFVKQVVPAVNTMLIVLVNDARLVTVQVDPLNAHTAPEIDVVQLLLGVNSVGTASVTESRFGEEVVIVNGEVMLIVRVEFDSSTKLLDGVQLVARVAAVIVTEAVLCQTQYVSVSLVVVCTLKLIVLANQLFCILVMATTTELGKVVPLRVICNKDELTVKQVTLISLVDMLHWNPLNRLIEDGKLNNNRQPEQCVCEKVAESWYVVMSLAVELAGAIEKKASAVGMVMVIVRPVVVYYMRLELKQVQIVIDEVGLVDRGLMILAMSMVEVVFALRLFGTHPLNLNFILDSTAIVQLLIKLAPDLKEVKAAFTEFSNYQGKVTTMQLPLGRAFLFCRVMVQVELAATMAEEAVIAEDSRVTGVAVRVRLLLSISTGVDVLEQYVLMVKEEVGVVVAGLLALAIVIAQLLPTTATAVLIFTITAVELNSEQVELTLHEQVVLLVNDISLGRVTIIFELETNVLIETKLTVMFETTPIELLDIEAKAEVIADTAAETVIVRLSIWKQLLLTKFIVMKVIELDKSAQGALISVKLAINRALN